MKFEMVQKDASTKRRKSKEKNLQILKLSHAVSFILLQNKLIKLDIDLLFSDVVVFKGYSLPKDTAPVYLDGGKKLLLGSFINSTTMGQYVELPGT